MGDHSEGDGACHLVWRADSTEATSEAFSASRQSAARTSTRSAVSSWCLHRRTRFPRRSRAAGGHRVLLQVHIVLLRSGIEAQLADSADPTRANAELDRAVALRPPELLPLQVHFLHLVVPLPRERDPARFAIGHLARELADL